MSRTISLVQAVQIASPCTAKWDDMVGDERLRYCSHCKLNVYNLSAMTEEEGERLIIEMEGKLCARIYRRFDGTILTRDCPVGLRALRRRAAWIGMRAAAALAFIVAGAAFAIADQSSRLRAPAPIEQGRIRPFDASSNNRTVRSLHRWLTMAAPAPVRVTLGLPAIPPFANGQSPSSAGSVPKPLSANDVASMSKNAARAALLAIVRAERCVQDPNTKQRLRSERLMLMNRLKRANP